MKTLFTTLLLLLIGFTGFSQTIIFTGVKSIEYHPEYEEWDEWPDDWVTLEDENSFSMYISEEVRGKVYKVTLYQNDEYLDDVTVRYDPDKSVEIRESWDNEYINCYRDSNGDYIYAQNVSLEQLAEDSSPWTDEDAFMYFFMFSENTGLLFK